MVKETSKKYLQLAKYYPPEYGGIEYVTLQNSIALSENGIEATVVCFTKQQAEVKDAVFAKVVRCRALSSISGQPISLGYLFKGIVSSFESDVVVAHMPNILAAIVCLFIPKKVRLVVQWHSDIVDKPRFITLLMNAFLKLLNAKSDLILVTSAQYAASSRLLLRHGKKIRVLPLSGRDVMHGDGADRFVASFDFRYVLAVGRLVPYKGFDSLIGNARSWLDLSPGTKLVLVGEGPEAANLKVKAKEAGIEERVLFLGSVPNRLLNTLYQNADVFVLPSVNKAEAYGVVLLEAMSAGLPVVVFDIPGSGVPWVAQHLSSGLVVPHGDFESFGYSISKLLCDEELRLNLSVGARGRFNELSDSRYKDDFVAAVSGV